MAKRNLTYAEQHQLLNYANTSVNCFVNRKYKGLFTAVEIEDIVGDTLYKVCRSIDTYDETQSRFNAWVNKIAINCVIDALDYKMKRSHISNLMFMEDENGEELDLAEIYGHDAHENDADRHLLSNEFESEVGKVTCKLSEQKQKTLSMIMDGKTPAEMAIEEGWTPTTAATRKCRLLKEIKEPISMIAKEYGIFPARRVA